MKAKYIQRIHDKNDLHFLMWQHKEKNKKDRNKRIGLYFDIMWISLIVFGFIWVI